MSHRPQAQLTGANTTMLGRGEGKDQTWVYLLVGEDGLIRGQYVTTDDPPPMATQSHAPARPWWRIL